MKDARAIEAIAMQGIKAIAFGQKEFDRARSRLRQWFANGPTRVELGARIIPKALCVRGARNLRRFRGKKFTKAKCIPSSRRILNRISLLPQAHVRFEVRQMIERARAPNRQTIRRVQRKEPDAGHAV